MGDLIVPGGRGRKPKPTRVLEQDSKTAALIRVPEIGEAVVVSTPEEHLILGTGDWMIVEAELWTAMIVQVMQAKDVLEASSRAGRRARKVSAQSKRDRRN